MLAVEVGPLDAWRPNGASRKTEAMARGDVGEGLSFTPFGEKAGQALQGTPHVQLTQTSRGWLRQQLLDRGILPDGIAVENPVYVNGELVGGTMRGVLEVKAVSLKTFKKELKAYIARLEKYANEVLESAPSQDGFRQFYTRQKNIEWLVNAAKGTGGKVNDDAAKLVKLLQEKGFGIFDTELDSFRPHAIPDFDDTFRVLRP